MSGTGATRKAVTRRGALLLALAVPGAVSAQAAPAARVEVWQDPTCGCCEGWVRHMRAAGFDVAVRKVADVRPVKAANGVPEALWSCHTAVVDGYVIEGHVPAADVQLVAGVHHPVPAAADQAEAFLFALRSLG